MILSNQSKSIRSEKKGEQRMKQDKAERKRWPYCERVRRLIKLMSESFSLMRAVS
ncbi:hypothetical protein KVK04_02840 [Helicobacter pylori]|nr:hypothetical protein KVK04_02840 [Helicobacter pylori]